jgi:predicted ATP-grasp superfamily ATP-dependent carboligase
MQGLQAARILARRNVPVIAIANDHRSYSCHTAVCERILFANTSNEELLALLEGLGPTLGQKAVLFPCQDKNVLLVSRHRQRLEQWFHIVLPAPDVVELMIDKVRFYSFIQQEKLPIAKTLFLQCRADAEKAAQSLGYPCVLKPPYRPVAWTQHTKQKAFKATNATEFLALYDHYCRWADVLIAQEWIEGPDANLYSCNFYFDTKGQPVVTFMSRKLRQWPPRTGQSCLGEECRNDLVLQVMLDLFSRVHYRGLGYLEMKKDERTGEYFIVEPNVGRPTGRSAIAEAAGVELLYTMYCDATGLPLPANRTQHYRGIKWIHLLRDLQSATYYWRCKELTFIEWWRSLQGTSCDAVFSWRDPLPFLHALRLALPTYFSPRELGSEDL